jgi:hypothetical protein
MYEYYQQYESRITIIIGTVEELRPRRLVRVYLLVHPLVYSVIYYIVHYPV